MNNSRWRLAFQGVRGDATRVFVFQVICYPLSIGREVLIARVLGPTGRGVYAFAVLCSQLFLTVFSGISSAVAFQVSKRQSPPPKVLGNALALSLLVGYLPLAAVAAGFIWWRESSNWLPFAAVASILLLLVTCFNGLFLGMSDIHGVNILQFTPSLFFLVLSAILLLGLRMGVRGALSAWIGGYAIALIWIWRRSGMGLPNVLQGGISAEGMRSLLLFTLRVGGANALSFLNYRVDSFMVQRLVGFRTFGIYSVGVAVSEVIWLISRSVSTACYGRLGEAPKSEAGQLASRAIRQTAVALLVAAAGIGIVGVFLIPILFGSPFRGAVPVLLVLLPGNMLYGVGSILGAYFTNHLGRPEVGMYISGLSAAICFSACLVLIPRFGMLGGALASSISYVVAIAVCYAWFIQVSHVSWRDVLLFRKSDWGSNVRLLRAMLGRDA